jgi:glycosyltransferase involved in cell wall biosynthesis
MIHIFLNGSNYQYNKMITFSIVTPCLNAEYYIEETILSVLNQTSVSEGRISLEYILCDGGSIDRTCEIAESLLKESKTCKWQIFSAKDNSMYEALVKGLKQVNGNFCAYLNAGDILSCKAFEVLIEIFENPEIKWVSGMKVVINEDSQIIRARLPYRYRKSFIRKGYYGDILPFIQQDACFWRTELNNLLDYGFLSGLKLAGDYYLWFCFSKAVKLFVVNTHISSFRVHSGQKSENKTAYRKEKRLFLARRPFALLLDLPVILYDWLFYFSDHIKNKANKSTLIEYNTYIGRWEVIKKTRIQK